MKTIPDLLTMAIANLERVVEQCDRTTSGNVSHQIATIKGIAGRTSEFLKKHTPENIDSDIRLKAIHAFCWACQSMHNTDCQYTPKIECAYKSTFIQKLDEQ